MLAMRLRFLACALGWFCVFAWLVAHPGLLPAQSPAKRPVAPAGTKSPKRLSEQPSSSERASPERSESLRVARNREDAPELQAPPIGRDPNRKVMQVASLTAEEVQAKRSTALRKSVTVYVPKLVHERQNVTRTIMAPVTSHELRPMWSPGQGRWIAYQPTSQTLWTPRSEVVTMEVPVWRYVAETRYVEEPVAQRRYYAPTQTAPDAWAWKQPTAGAGAQPMIPPYQPPHRPVVSFLKSRPLVGRLFGGGRPVFPPAPSPIGPTAANYQPVSLYTPYSNGTFSAASGNGIPSFTAPQLPTAGATGNFGGVRTYQ